MLFALLGTVTTLVGVAVSLLWRMHELGRLRADFTSSVSHELRTPLTQILLYAETLEMERHRSPAKRAEAINVITRETRRLIHLVENVLQFSRRTELDARRAAATSARRSRIGDRRCLRADRREPRNAGGAATARASARAGRC